MAAASSSSSIISIHALLAESDGTASPGPPDRTISIHALLAESDDHCTHLFNCFTNFYPRSPCGERHVSTKGSYHTMANFYPRSPCGERLCRPAFAPAAHNFYPRSPCGERPTPSSLYSFSDVFLSTLSLRRATSLIDGRRDNDINFYPRSPCGERLTPARISSRLLLISIHALLAESDSGTARHT